MEDVRRSLRRHERTFERLCTVAGSRAAAGRWRAAVALAQVASDYAYHDHPGRFADERLERILDGAGAAMLAPWATTERRATTDRVLHVLTEGYALGGHTRLVWRWIAADAGRRHSVALTRQRGEAPAALGEAVAATGGAVHDLSSIDGLLARAGRLRTLARDVDVVVLHVHPFDVVPAIAFGGRRADARCGPAVVHFNHADHVFWVGTSAADVVADIRGSGRDLAVARRGTEPRRHVRLPIPIPAADRAIERSAAKRALGIPADAVVLLTAASPSKYVGVPGAPHFLELVLPVLEKEPDAVLVACGPTGPAWAAAGERTGGRVQAAGPTTDLALPIAAADVYLDSYPFASLTSSLEGASVGNPVLSFAPQDGDGLVMAVDDDALDRHLLRARTVDEYQSLLIELVEDERGRQERGAATAWEVLAQHTGDGWRGWVEDVYEAARRADPARPRAVPAAGPSELDELLVSWNAATGMDVPLASVLWRHRDDLPPLHRAIALVLQVASKAARSVKNRTKGGSR